MKWKPVLFVMVMTATVAAQNVPAPPNYDESKVPAYVLPDPLVCLDGTKVTSVPIWEAHRRPELLRLFEEQIYGRAPAKPTHMAFEASAPPARAHGGNAIRKEVAIRLTDRPGGPVINLLLYLPDGATGRMPVILGLNFDGNHTVSADRGITLSDRWVAGGGARPCVTSNRATDACRGSAASQWAVDKILAHGYALATVYYGDLEPDFPEGWKQGVRAALTAEGGHTAFKPDEWGAIAAWAWGLSRVMDYLETDPAIDARRVALFGHSRLGKTALWAGARDARFALVISNESGEGGAALARRPFGERTADLNRVFPHWFCGNFKRYSGHEEALPVDQHELIALLAPRPVYVASAEEDRWSDPRGEFLAAVAAEPVYRLFGKTGLGTATMPGLNQPVGTFVGYHIRPGKHDVTGYDWDQYLAFADRHLKKAVAGSE